jgi:hypothetical protein
MSCAIIAVRPLGPLVSTSVLLEIAQQSAAALEKVLDAITGSAASQQELQRAVLIVKVAACIGAVSDRSVQQSIAVLLFKLLATADSLPATTHLTLNDEWLLVATEQNTTPSPISAAVKRAWLSDGCTFCKPSSDVVDNIIEYQQQRLLTKATRLPRLSALSEQIRYLLEWCAQSEPDVSLINKLTFAKDQWRAARDELAQLYVQDWLASPSAPTVAGLYELAAASCTGSTASDSNAQQQQQQKYTRMLWYLIAVISGDPQVLSADVALAASVASELVYARLLVRSEHLYRMIHSDWRGKSGALETCFKQHIEPALESTQLLQVILVELLELATMANGASAAESMLAALSVNDIVASITAQRQHEIARIFVVFDAGTHWSVLRWDTGGLMADLQQLCCDGL